MGGVAFQAASALTFAVTGATCPVSVDGHAAAWGEAVTVPAGSRVVIGAATTGVRSYVALSGGVAVEPVLGSRSTDTLSYVGPPLPRAGDVLPIGPAQSAPGDGVAVPRGGPVVLRYLPGPRNSWFTDLPRGGYTVTGDSNRVGLRLAGTALGRTREGELPSEGIVLGAIQVPPNGQPLVFLNDHPTTGGYPVVGVVLPEDLPQCAQLRPGDVASLRPV